MYTVGLAYAKYLKGNRYMAMTKRSDHKDRFKFHQQKASAKARGIDWQLTYEEWFKIWQDSGQYHNRGRNRGQYCMSRYGDIGPYSVDNVFIQEFEKNYAAVGYKSKGRKKSKEHIDNWRKSYEKTKHLWVHPFKGKPNPQAAINGAGIKGLKRIYRDDGSFYYKELNK